MSWYNEESEANQEPWSSIVDLMSAFALVLFLAVTFFIVNYSQANEQLKKRSLQLDLKVKQLKSSMIALQDKSASLKKSKDSEARLNALAIRLAKQNSDVKKQLIVLGQKEKKLLEEKQKLIGERERLEQEKGKLLAEREQLRSQKDDLSKLVQRKQQLVQKQKEQTAQQNAVLAQTQAQQKRCENQLKSLLAQRRNVLSAIYKSFQSQSGTRGIGFDPRTGKFRLGGNVLFAEGKDQLTEEGRKQLRQVLQALDKVIFQPKIRPMLSGIMIEGHTSRTGGINFNFKLSARRALKAVEFLLAQVPQNSSKYQAYSKLLFASAFGQFRPVIGGNKQIDERRSRRIEIKVLFKNQERIREILRRQQN